MPRPCPDGPDVRLALKFNLAHKPPVNEVAGLVILAHGGNVVPVRVILCLHVETGALEPTGLIHEGPEIGGIVINHDLMVGMCTTKKGAPVIGIKFLEVGG